MLILALDFGGTKHAAATVAFGERQWRQNRRVLSLPFGDASTDLAMMRSLIQDLLHGEKPSAIGVSFGGLVDAATGTVQLSHHVKGWENTPLREMLEAEFGVPVSVDNDANVAALGEHRFGAGQGFSSLLYITVSTGIGGGWILNGHPWRGAEGMAGEIGHMVIDSTGPLCLCGKRGCLERLASRPYIAQQADEWLRWSRSVCGAWSKSIPPAASHPDQGAVLRTLVRDSRKVINTQIVSQAAAQKDEVATKVLERAGWAMGVGIGNVVNLINPQRFVLGGGVTKAGDQFWQMVRQVAKETALPEVHFDIVPAALGDEAPCGVQWRLQKTC